MLKTTRLAFGENGFDLHWDEDRVEAAIILPVDAPALADANATFLEAVRNPLGSPSLRKVGETALAPARRSGRLPKVVIVIADHTRPVPDRLLAPWLVEELGVPDEAVTILVGTGTHRGSTPQELRKMLGDAVDRFRVVNHDCEAANLSFLGNSSCGGECWMNPLWVEADLRLATGFIEPHFYAGFSGGSKAIVPGIAGLRTVQHFHRASLIAHPNTTWGDWRTNPLQRLTREMTTLCPPHFIVNVTLNRAKEITGVFAGEMIAAHEAGCEAAWHEAMIPVARTYPIVVTTNSGYPLDQNFYQTVKGISAAARIVAPGGTILAVSRCNLGLPDEGEFRRILSDAKSSDALHSAIQSSSETRQDQWQVQTLLQCLERARVVLYSELSAEQRQFTRTAHTDDPSGTLAKLTARSNNKVPVAILPLGPLTIPAIA
jgi:nickel-dependent lactate racemase